MAYVSQELKKELTPWIKAVLDKYSMKGSISVEHYSTLVCTLKEWPINFINYLADTESNRRYASNSDINVNQYHVQSQFVWIAKDFLMELRDAMMKWNHDNSDLMTDYYDIGWYINISIWRYDKDYIVR